MKSAPVQHPRALLWKWFNLFEISLQWKILLKILKVFSIREELTSKLFENVDTESIEKSNERHFCGFESLEKERDDDSSYTQSSFHRHIKLLIGNGGRAQPCFPLTKSRKQKKGVNRDYFKWATTRMHAEWPPAAFGKTGRVRELRRQCWFYIHGSYAVRQE